MKRFLLTLVLMIALTGTAQAEVTFEDDFEAYADGYTIVYGGTQWYNPKGDVTVTADDGTFFETDNKYVDMYNPGGVRTVLREWLSPTLSNTLATLSLDIHEPNDLTANRFIVKCSSQSGTGNWLSDPSVWISFSNGVVSPQAGGQSASYTLDAPHHIDIVVNMTDASATYYGNTLATKTYDVWIDYELVMSDVPFHSSIAARILGLALEIPDADTGTMYFDNVKLRNDASFLNTELPADAVIYPGEDAINPITQDTTGLSYQWYFSDSGDANSFSGVGTDSPILAITNAQTADEGSYYCDVTIDSNSITESSKNAQLIFKQPLARWTMDQSDFVGGEYVDIVGGHNADANSTPPFVAGAGPLAPANGAAVMAPDSYGFVGTWNPLETTGQMTLSAWIKWDGTLASEVSSSGKDILSKASGWGPDVMMWNLKMRNTATNGNAGIWLYNQASYGLRPNGVIAPDTWTHVCVTYDSGVARLYINGEWVPGAMDEVMIHNYAMPAEDVAALYYQTSKEAVCLNPLPSELDLNDDCKIDLQDFAIFAATWADCGLVPTCLP